MALEFALDKSVHIITYSKRRSLFGKKADKRHHDGKPKKPTYKHLCRECPHVAWSVQEHMEHLMSDHPHKAPCSSPSKTPTASPSKATTTHQVQVYSSSMSKHSQLDSNTAVGSPSRQDGVVDSSVGSAAMQLDFAVPLDACGEQPVYMCVSREEVVQTDFVAPAAAELVNSPPDVAKSSLTPKVDRFVAATSQEGSNSQKSPSEDSPETKRQKKGHNEVPPIRILADSDVSCVGTSNGKRVMIVKPPTASTSRAHLRVKVAKKSVKQAKKNANTKFSKGKVPPKTRRTRRKDPRMSPSVIAFRKLASSKCVVNLGNRVDAKSASGTSPARARKMKNGKVKGGKMGPASTKLKHVKAKTYSARRKITVAAKKDATSEATSKPATPKKASPVVDKQSPAKDKHSTSVKRSPGGHRYLQLPLEVNVIVRRNSSSPKSKLKGKEAVDKVVAESVNAGSTEQSCMVCDAKFVNQKLLNEHILEVHALQSEMRGGAPSLYKCPHCNTAFLTISLLNRHIGQRHTSLCPDPTDDHTQPMVVKVRLGQTRHNRNVEYEGPSGQPIFNCFQCKKQFSTLKQLDEHMVTTHISVKIN